MAIFSHDLLFSKIRLEQDIFIPGFMTWQLFMQVLEKGHDNFDYIKKEYQRIVRGQNKLLSVEKLRELLENPKAIALKDFMAGSVHVQKQYKKKTQEEEYTDKIEQAQKMLNQEEEPEELEICDENEEQEPEEVLSNELPWISKHISNCPLESDKYTWYYTILTRVNASHFFAKMHVRDKFHVTKVRAFQNAHVRIVQYLDSLADPSDANIDEAHLLSLYKPLGLSHLSCDYDAINITHREHKLKPRPLEILRAAYPEYKWTVEECVGNTCWHISDWQPLDEIPQSSPETHQLYLACVAILNQISSLIPQAATPQLRYTLWEYYACFTDLFFHCIIPHQRADDMFLLHPIGSTLSRDGKTINKRSDSPTPWEKYYPYDTRAFTAGDLPDYTHILFAIPLIGEQRIPPYFLGKIYQKSMPFASQRRHLVKLVVKHVLDNDAFASTFACLCWVQMARLYPDSWAVATTNYPTMRDLVRIRELVSDKQRLCSIFNPKQATGAPLIMLAVIRMHILYMASFNDIYLKHARECIDWDLFRQDVINTSNIICDLGFFPQDPFAQARRELTKTKNPNARIYRVRKRIPSVIMTEHFNTFLEKCIFRNKQLLSLDRQAMLSHGAALFFEKTKIGQYLKKHGAADEQAGSLMEYCLKMTKAGIAWYNRLVDIKCKAQILNTLIRVPPEDRLSRRAFSILLDFGATEACIDLLCEMLVVYHNKAVPKDFNNRIDEMVLKDFVLATYYMNVITMLDKISFVTLDAETVQRTDKAIANRYFPGQPVPDEAYNICFALCCEKVYSLMGHGKFGSKRVAYDMERESFVCAHGKSIKTKLGKEEEEEEEDEEDEDDSKDEDEEEEEEDEEDRDLAECVLQAQDEGYNPMMEIVGKTQLSKKKARSPTVLQRKIVRNERKAFSKVPCGQPVLHISLRGRALIWGNKADRKTQIMLCPQCGALHVYTILNFSQSPNGMYRCNECARKEMSHVDYNTCAFCEKHIHPKHVNSILVIDETNMHEPFQQVYLCKPHHRMARGSGGYKKQVWARIKKAQELQLKRLAMSNVM
jgi:hypothetical protein